MVTYVIAAFYHEWCVYAARDGVRIPGTTSFHATHGAALREIDKRQGWRD